MRKTNRLFEGSRSILVLLSVLALTLGLLDSRDSVITRAIRSLAATVMTPADAFVRGTTEPVTSFFDDWQTLGSKDERIDELEAANARLRERLALSADLERHAKELDGLLGLAGKGEVRIVAGRVIAIGSSQAAGHAVTIDIGRNDGIRQGMNVIAGGGLVGRVSALREHNASVTLIIDPSSTVGARIEGSGEIGFVSGTGNSSELQLQLIDPYAQLRVGDRLVSFGVKGGVYGSGYPIGEVTSVRGKAGTSTRVATVKPFVQMRALDIVGVAITKPRGDVRDSLLPPRPTPTPTPEPLPSDGALPLESATATPSPTTTKAAA